MTPLLAIAALFFVAAITPGPNNLIVMRRAARVGFLRAMLPVAAIVAGSVALLAVVIGGLGSAISEWPLLGVLLGAGGAAYLIWLGLRLAWANGAGTDDPKLPADALGIFIFQFANPKAWLMMVTAVAASPTTGARASFVRLVPLAILIPAACLLLWAALGHALSRQLAEPRVRLWTDRIFGLLLIAGALPLLDRP